MLGSQAAFWINSQLPSLLQVGVNIRMMVFNPFGSDKPGNETILVNPEIISVSGPRMSADEGCLSFPGTYAPVEVRILYLCFYLYIFMFHKTALPSTLGTSIWTIGYWDGWQYAPQRCQNQRQAPPAQGLVFGLSQGLWHAFQSCKHTAKAAPHPAHPQRQGRGLTVWGN